ncbi:MAG: alpha/beta hydrolase-fold protein [Chryseolinea sp.]
MKSIFLIIACVLVSLNYCAGQISTGEIIGPIQLKSKIYPGTLRDYWVYVPKQYDPSTPACLMVVQDGLSRATGWKLPQVLDSLIALKRIPPIIGVFVDHGYVPSSDGDAFPRYNRSFEYDAMGDRYANFLLNELLPEVSKSYNITKDPNNRSIAGASSGAICAFNVAWERPDQFRRVLSTIGTYVGLRGADEFVTLVRKSETRPLRIYLEDGDHDLNIYAGDWWMSNQSMLSALNYAGYEVNHGWGQGGHDSKHAITIMAEALEWLWKDYPTPIATHKGIAPRVNLLIDDESWREIKLDGKKVSHISVDQTGNILFADKGMVYSVDGTDALTAREKLKVDGKLICAAATQLFMWIESQRKIVSIDKTGKTIDVITNCDAADLLATTNGLYFSEPLKQRISYYDFATKAIKQISTEFVPRALAINAEKTFLNVASSDTPFGYSFRVNKDGSLEFGQEYIHYHIPYGKAVPGLAGMTVDSQNLLYTATSMGIQVADQLGRINFIFSKNSTKIDDVKIGGQDFDKLFVAGDGKLFMRKITAKGLTPFGEAVKPPKPGL